MALLGLTGVTLELGGNHLLDGVAFQIEPGERIGLLGRNGSGKSSLMALLAGDLVPDEGEVTRRQGLRCRRLPQEVPRDLAGRVGDFVAAGLPEGEEGWRAKARLEALFEGLALDPDADLATLSAGLSRRALLARALAQAPDVLLLDEPTNHLDVPSIQWLEAHLLEREGATLFVTHDRAFLRRLATRIVELDRGRLTSWPGDWANYLRRREEREADETRRVEQAQKLLAKEEVWVRKGLKAQRNRNQSRVEALERLRAERRDRRDPQGQVRLSIAEAERSGTLVAEAKGLVAGYEGKPVVGPLDLVVLRGDRLGVVGANGTGKTTLLRTLLGDLPPLEGSLRRGTNLRPIWFDPLHAALDPEVTVRDAVADGADQLDLDGRRRHVISYLADFLFPAERSRQPVSKLSGGERARLLLARLFARPSNLLVLDEPTNDLDAETMEVLEEAIAAYPGTILVVSHDRDFLDEVTTSLLVLDGRGGAREVVGGWSEWERLRVAPPPPPRRPVSAPRPAGDHRAAARDRRELENVERKIARLEEEQRALHAKMEQPDFWTGPAGEVEAARLRLAAVEAEVAAAYARWTSLQG